MSVWEDGLQTQINRQIADNPMMGAAYSNALTSIQAGYYDERYLSAIHQDFYPGSNIYTAAAFTNIHTALANGQILYTTVHIGMKPTADKEVKAMSKMLGRLSSMRFYSIGEDGKQQDEPLSISATFHGGNQADYDGEFCWTGPLEFGIKGKRKTTILSGSFPLEVGYIPGARALAILSRLRCLARWPYGQDELWLFYVVDDALWTPFTRPAIINRVEFSREWNPKEYKPQRLFEAA